MCHAAKVEMTSSDITNYKYGINEKKCNNFPFHYFPFPVHSYFTTEYVYAYSTQLSTVFALSKLEYVCTYVLQFHVCGMENCFSTPHLTFQARVDFQWYVELEMESLLSIPYFQCGISFHLYRSSSCLIHSCE